jgi:hypothetical protein
LKNCDYNRIHDQNELACLEIRVHQGNSNSKNLLLRAKSVKRLIFVRRLAEGIWYTSIIHEILHIYFPQAEEEIIVQAEGVFETAFLCYGSLYGIQQRRNFFLELCKESSRLLKWAGLPKFDASKISEFEEELFKNSKKDNAGVSKESNSSLIGRRE